MAVRVALVYKSESMYYSLEELINHRLKFIEEDKGEVLDVTLPKENTALIRYKI